MNHGWGCGGADVIEDRRMGANLFGDNICEIEDERPASMEHEVELDLKLRLGLDLEEQQQQQEEEQQERQ